MMYILALLASGTAAADQVPNSSFEQMNGDTVSEWKPTTFGGEATFGVGNEGHTGSHCVTITSARGADAAYMVMVPVEGDSVYRVSGWVKTENVGSNGGFGALINIHNKEPVRSDAVVGTKGWTKVSAEFRTAANESRVQVNCLLGGFGNATGTAMFDDISVEKVTIPASSPVVVHANDPMHPASKYLYSQFIEHLGRCIYGGIWSEMLEDRKFFYNIDGRSAWRRPGRPTPGWEGQKDPPFDILVASPWVIEGDKAMVTKTKTKWRLDPVLTLDASKGNVGISQDRLGTKAGKGYEGHFTARGNGTVMIWLDGGGKKASATVKISGNDFKKGGYVFKGVGSDENAKFGVTVTNGKVDLAAVSLMPDDNVEGFRADTLALLKELHSPMYRWPGGNFASGYDWRDGIGDPDKRPTFRNPAWTGIDTNDMGTHEFMRFCKLVDTEPLLVANTGFGDPYTAGQWVQYCNGSTDTAMGKWRAENGSRAPFNVKWWGVGNEMFGSWQLGYMDLNQYKIKHRWTAEKMLQQDPNLELVGVGDANSNFSVEMLRSDRDSMNVISEHLYCQDRSDVRDLVDQMTGRIKNIADKHRTYRQTIPALKDNPIRVSLDEWNYWYGPYIYGELGTAYSLKDGLGIAAGLHQLYRDADIYEIAMYAQTVNVIGCIKTTKTDAWMETTGEVLALYNREFGKLPVKVDNDHLIQGVDVCAAKTEDGKYFTVSIVNSTSSPVSVPVSFEGVVLKGEGQSWTMSGSNPLATNDTKDHKRVSFKPGMINGVPSKLDVPGYGVRLYRFPIGS